MIHWDWIVTGIAGWLLWYLLWAGLEIVARYINPILWGLLRGFIKGYFDRNPSLAGPHITELVEEIGYSVPPIKIKIEDSGVKP